MDRMWLVQKGRFIENPENRNSFDDFISCDYMGACEFECVGVYENGKYVTKNPLCLSLKRIIKNRSNYQWIKMLKRKDALNNQLYIFCKNEDTEQAKEFVRGLLKGNATKRSTGLYNYYTSSVESLQEDSNSRHFVNFWWDIENDIFIVFGEDKVDILNEAMDRNYEKWKDELFPTTKKSIIDKFKALFNLKSIVNA